MVAWFTWPMSTEARWVASMPETYDRCLGPALFAPFAAHLAAMAEALSPERVLELAAGTGIVTAELVRRLPRARITATDLNPAMTAWARSQVAGPTWQQADAQQLPFDDNTFDLVVCQFGAMFFPDKRRAFAESARVLAPNGTALFAVWDVVEASRFASAAVDAVARVLPDDPPTFIVRVPHGYTDPAQIAADLESSGLHGVCVERIVLTGRAPSARALAEGFCLGTPLRFALEQRGDLERLTGAVADEMTSALGAGAVEGEMAAFIASGHGRP